MDDEGEQYWVLFQQLLSSSYSFHWACRKLGLKVTLNMQETRLTPPPPTYVVRVWDGGTGTFKEFETNKLDDTAVAKCCTLMWGK